MPSTFEIAKWSYFLNIKYTLLFRIDIGKYSSCDATSESNQEYTQASSPTETIRQLPTEVNTTYEFTISVQYSDTNTGETVESIKKTTYLCNHPRHLCKQKSLLLVDELTNVNEKLQICMIIWFDSSKVVS